VSGRVQRRQAEKYAARDQQIAANRGAGYAEGAQSVQAAPAPAAPQDDTIAKLQQLADLHTQGVLTDDEFAAAKAKLLT
jgi:hypothetical protein